MAHGQYDLRKPSQKQIQLKSANARSVNYTPNPNKSLVIRSDSHSMEIFEREKFKTVECRFYSEHDKEICLRYHSEYDRRRPEDMFTYFCNPCGNSFDPETKQFLPHKCGNRDKCEFAHNKNEIIYHQDYYKTKPC